ncbi:hypothetical protein OIU74_025915 [Salix koriyanagi]|uniref:Uncharacterized protein n=1 Tax=Salix koriyanagi TaxID=2511006 RepID=A0A9Q1A5R9_9ROSI|nr:hypothetical protein OIU74_025915 [Salix koriyanagi]
MRSKPGEEPTEPYTYLQIDPPRREASNFWLSHHMRELQQTFRTWSGGIGILAFCFALMIWFIEYK